MQGQRGTIDSFSEILEYSHGSTPNNTLMNQRISWNNMQNPTGSLLPGYMLASNPETAYVGPVNQEVQILDEWNLAEPNFISLQNELNHGIQQTRDGGLTFSAGQRSEEQQHEPPNLLSVGSIGVNTSIFPQTSNSNRIPQNINLNASFGSGSGNVQFQPTSSSNTFMLSSEGSDHRLSSKRKRIEESLGQSSINGSSNYLQHGENSLWHGSSGLGTTSSSSEQANQGVYTRTSNIMSGSLATGSSESSRRSLRRRINPVNVNQQESAPLPLTSAGNSVSSPQQSIRPVPVDNAIPQYASNTSQIPPILENVHTFGWDVTSSLRASRSVNSVRHEEMASRIRTRNIEENPRFLPTAELSNWARNQINRTSIPNNVGSSSRSDSISAVNPLSGPRQVDPNPASSIYSRSWSDHLRRSLASSSADPGSQNNSLLHSSSTMPSLSERAVSFGAGNNEGHLSLNSREISSLMEQQGDNNALLTPLLLRTLASAGEARGRLVASEHMHSVISLMRRQRRLEEVMLRDQSLLFAGLEHRDRHRGMRLDVDNMSYEELIALEDRIGNVSTGLSEEFILKRLKQQKFSTLAVATQQETEPCCICQEEYTNGEDIGTLDCKHEFHADCIKQWLMHKNLCPICKTTGLGK